LPRRRLHQQRAGDQIGGRRHRRRPRVLIGPQQIVRQSQCLAG